MSSRFFFVAGAATLVAICSAPQGFAREEDPVRPPVDRVAALQIAPKFAGEIEAALTQPVVQLYDAALTGAARDKWVFGLALTAERHTLEPMLPAQRALYLDYSRRVEDAKAKYQKKHRNKDISEMPAEAFVKPTAEEIEAVRIAQHINTPAVWLDAAKAAYPIDQAPVLSQSVACLVAVKEKIDADDMMTQLLSGLMGVTATSSSEKSEETSATDLAQITKELDDSPKSDEELDSDALCGGAEAFAKDMELLKTVYTPSLRITVSRGKGD